MNRTGEGAKRSPLSSTVVVLSGGSSPFLLRVLRAVLERSAPPTELKLIWSGSDSVPDSLPAVVQVESIDPGTFDHGGTRQSALERCATDVLVFLSDDAEPATDDWLEAILRPFNDPSIGAVYGRHLPRPEAPMAEQAFRAVRYPAKSCSIDSVERVISTGLLSLPISDANSAYRAAALKAVGGFARPCAHGEDLLAALALLDGGWTLSYAGEAAVWHSHDLRWYEIIERGWRAARTTRNGGQESRRVRSHHGFRAGSAFVLRMVAVGWQEHGLMGVASVMLDSALRAAGYMGGIAVGGAENAPSA